MPDSHEKGAFQADIPSNAVEEALRSVEKLARADAPVEALRQAQGERALRQAQGEREVEVEVEPPAAAGSDPVPEDPAELAARLGSLEAQLELSQAKARETLDRLKETHERHLRAAADLENYRKRANKEKDEVQRFGIEKVVKDLLPALDGLDRALAAAPAGDPLVDGVKLVRAAFEQGLARHGVKGFSALGEPFDPARHEALLQVPTADAAEGTVVLEHARGFTLNDRLLRAAMVGVAVGPPPGGGPAPSGEPDASGERGTGGDVA